MSEKKAEPQKVDIFEAARKTEEADLKRQKAAEEAGVSTQPNNVRYHADGTPKRMIVQRPNGSGQREITVEEWETNPAFFRAAVGSWVIKNTEAVGDHHSTNIV